MAAAPLPSTPVGPSSWLQQHALYQVNQANPPPRSHAARAWARSDPPPQAKSFSHLSLVPLLSGHVPQLGCLRGAGAQLSQRGNCGGGEGCSRERREGQGKEVQLKGSWMQQPAVTLAGQRTSTAPSSALHFIMHAHRLHVCVYTPHLSIAFTVTIRIVGYGIYGI
jgi:hypothetical protein